MTRLDLLGEMIDETARWFPNREFLLFADRLYEGSPAIGDLSENVEVIVRLKRDAKIYPQPERPENPGRGRPRKKGKQLPQPKEWKTRLRVIHKSKSHPVRNRGRSIYRIKEMSMVLDNRRGFGGESS